jgi:hypothetical protein
MMIDQVLIIYIFIIILWLIPILSRVCDIGSFSHAYSEIINTSALHRIVISSQW